jgi:hypothetical protein
MHELLCAKNCVFYQVCGVCLSTERAVQEVTGITVHRRSNPHMGIVVFLDSENNRIGSVLNGEFAETKKKTRSQS